MRLKSQLFLEKMDQVKSTLAKLIVGLLKPDTGEILIDGTNLDKLSLVWFKQRIAYVPQEDKHLKFIGIK